MNEERPIEKLLRRYAKKRSEEAGMPPELHPATRRLLQGEVARQFPNRAAAGAGQLSGTFLRDWLPWLGWATVMIVVVGVGVFMYYGGGRQQTQLALSPTKSQPATFELAKNKDMDAALGKKNIDDVQKELAVRNQPATPPPAATVAAPAMPSPKTPAPVRADTSVALAGAVSVSDVEKKSATGRNFSAPKPAAIASREHTKTESPSVTAGDKAGFAGGSATARQLVSTNSVSRRSEALPQVVGTADSLYSKSPPLARGGGLERDRRKNVGQSYSQVAPASRYANTAPSVPVLGRFQVEQTGNQLRVIDSDGSMYSGEMSAAELKKEKGADGELSSFARKENYLYQVTGTNRTLNRQVVFTWNFLTPTNQPATTAAPGATGALGKDKLGAKPAASASGTIIQGRARLSDGRDIEINAAPVKP